MQAKHRDWARTLVWSVPAILVGLPLAMIVDSQNQEDASAPPDADYPHALSAGEANPADPALLVPARDPRDALGDAARQPWQW